MFNIHERIARAIALIVAAFILRDVPGKFDYLARAITVLAKSFSNFIVDGLVARDGE